MPWQTMKDGEICGPLSDAEFDAMRLSLPPATKVHKDGWEDWRKLEDVPAAELPAPPPLPPRDESASVAAGFMRRAGAFIFDYLLIRWLCSLMGLGGQFWNNGYGWSYSSWSENSVSDLFGTAFWITLAYETLMISRLGWTLGKFIFGIRVSHDGLNLNYQRSALRVLAKKLNWLTLGIGYLMVSWDKEKKGLHDHLCKTRVFLR